MKKTAEASDEPVHPRLAPDRDGLVEPFESVPGVEKIGWKAEVPSPETGTRKAE